MKCARLFFVFLISLISFPGKSYSAALVDCKGASDSYCCIDSPEDPNWAGANGLVDGDGYCCNSYVREFRVAYIALPANYCAWVSNVYLGSYERQCTSGYSKCPPPPSLSDITNAIKNKVKKLPHPPQTLKRPQPQRVAPPKQQR